MNGGYLDFELQIEQADGDGAYYVAVIASPAGETQRPERISFPFDANEMERLQKELENALLRSRARTRQTLSREEAAVRRFGQKLFEGVFQGDIRSLLYESRLQAEHADRGLRLKLRLQPPEFARLPWEFLLEPRSNQYLCLSRETPIVRYIELPQPIPQLTVTPPLRILGLVANPLGLPPLDVQLEKQRIEEALDPARQDGRVELHWLEGQTAADLQRALRQQGAGAWHIFHFIGHGSFDAQRDEGVLWLADAQGKARPLTATQLAQLLGDHSSLRLAVLNACEGAVGSEWDVFSSTAATLVRRRLPAVLAMQYEISDTAAILLAEWFYESLADGLPVDAAVAEARKAIHLENDRSLEWGTPVLFMRAHDGRIFNLPARLKPAPLVRQPGSSRTRRLPWRLDGRGRPLIEAWEQLQGVENLPERIVWVKDHKEMALIPAGPFIMGTGEEEARQLAKTFAWDVRWTLAETPQRQVTLANFYLDVAPVTHADYARFLADNPTHRIPHLTETWASLYNWNEKSRRPPEELLDHPVVLVSWEDAAAYARWAGKALPTEEQWEKGARGNDGRTYPWSHTWDSSCLNSAERLAGRELPNATEWRKWWDKEQEALWKQVNTTPVGRYYSGASPYGLVDMAGNVWEWCDAWYAAYPGSQARHDDFGRKYRVVRGGAWNNYRNCARCACRSRYAPHDRGIDVGFRCASTPF